MGNIGPLAVSIIGSVIMLAMIAVVVSKKASTASVITASGQALSQIIGAAVSPVAGNSQNQFGASN